MLSAKWNSNDSDAKEEAKYQMSKTNPNTTKENPKNIHDDAQTTTRLWRSLNTFSKRAECQETKLQSLNAERNTDDGYHHSQTGNYILYSSNNTTKK